MFHEIQFDPTISYGSQGGPGFKTDIITVDSGSEQRLSRWSTPRRQYDVKWGIKTRAQMGITLAFYVARRGAAIGFRYKDWLDFTTASDSMSAYATTDCQIGIGDGTAVNFQLSKSYTSGPTTVTRNITKPVAGQISVAVDGTPVVSGWVVDTTTGVITFTTAPTLGQIITAGCQFDVPVRFGDAVDQSLQASIDDFDVTNIPSIPMIEIRDGVALDDAYSFGGATEAAVADDYKLTSASPRVLVISCSVSGKSVILPDNTSLPSGGPWYEIFVEGLNDVALVDSALATVLSSIAPNASVSVSLSVDGSGNRTWYVA